MIPLLLALIGAALYRIRGGWLPTGSTQLARGIWCAPTALLMAIVSGSWVCGIVSMLVTFLALLLPNDPWQRMETEDHWLHAAATGAIRLGALGLVLFAFTHNVCALLLLPAGALNAPLYWLGWKLPVLGGPVDWKTAWGELFFGALTWASLALC